MPLREGFPVELLPRVAERLVAFLQAPGTLALLRAEAVTMGLDPIAADRAARRWARWILVISRRLTQDTAEGGPLSGRVESMPLSAPGSGPGGDGN